MERKWLVLLASFLSWFSFLFSMQSIPPIIPAIMSEFAVDYSTVSTLILLVALPSIVLSIVAGFLAQKYNVKKMVSLGLVLTVIGSAASVFTTSFGSFQIARLILGIGGALITAIAPVSVYQFFEKKEMGVAMGVMGQAMPFATVIAFNSLGAIQVISGWRYAVSISVFISVVCFLVYILTVKEKKVETRKIELSAIKNRSIWLLGLVWGFFNMAAVGYSTWGKTIFFEFKAQPPAYSDLLASMFMLGGFACPLAGYLSDKVGKRKIFMIISTLGNAVVFFAFIFINQDLFLPFAVMLGVFDFLIPSVIFALPEEILGKERSGIGAGVLNTCLNMGVVIGPFVIGLILDATSSVTLSFLALGSFMTIGLILALAMKIR
jgi:MFS transporter, ACS family, aldohexuronate transporter